MMKITISLPLKGHTGKSLRNLVSMIYSRGPLLSKATGGSFSCTFEQVRALKGCLTVWDVQERITDDLIGISITDDTIDFTGFPLVEDPTVFIQLAEQMNAQAKEKMLVFAKKVDAANEKYSFRTWLLALGMSGPEFKTARKVLLSPLSGNAAFKDEATAKNNHFDAGNPCDS